MWVKEAINVEKREEDEFFFPTHFSYAYTVLRQESVEREKEKVKMALWL